MKYRIQILKKGFLVSFVCTDNTKEAERIYTALKMGLAKNCTVALMQFNGREYQTNLSTSR